MAGTAYYSLFLVMGVLYSDRIFKGKSLCFKIWAGGIIGNIVLMSGIIPLALTLGFTKLSHAIAAVLFTGVYFCIPKKDFDLKFSIYKPAAAAAGIITLLMCCLFYGHVMMPSDGGISTGQSTYGDLAMHMGFITSIAENGVFPPEFNLLSGTRLCYPFLIDSLSSSLYLLGTDLRTAVLYPSFVFAFLLTVGFYFFAEKLTENRKSAMLSVILFFLGGGFGFAYFLDGAKANHGVFTRIFTEYYKTPTNFNGYGIRWANPVCDMIIPQRTTMAGWCVLLFALWLLADALGHKSRKSYILLGIIAGTMPMIHTHSFLALGIISAAVFFASAEKDKNYFINWCIYGGIVFLTAVPQLVFWTFSQSVGNAQFLRFGFNWVNKSDPYLWFWLKNWGITAVFAVPAVLSAKKCGKKFAVGAAAVFAAAEFIIFQPNEYDNNKLFFVSYMICVILCSDYFVLLYNKLKSLPGTKFLAAAVIFAGTLSGVLTIAREWKSGGEYMTFTDGEIEFSEFVKANTSPESVFVTGSQHLNPAAVLAGRKIYAGSSLYVYYHGYGEEMEKRYSQIKQLYESRTREDFESRFEKIPDAKYLMITDSERKEFDIDENVVCGEKIYDKDGILLYEVKYY